MPYIKQISFTIVWLAYIFSFFTVKASTDTIKNTFITIGTGGATGVYYPTGGFICRLVNKKKKEHNIRCSAESTYGSIFNINAMRNQDLDFSIAQSDWQHYGYNGEKKFKKQGSFEEMRSFFSLYPETFTVVARKDTGIKTFRDLKGKRINIGNLGSGQRGTFEQVITHYRMTLQDFKLTTELKSSEQANALCDNKIDAFIFVSGHPNASIKDTTSSCKTIIVPMNGHEIDTFVSQTPYYKKTIIPGGIYNGTPNSVATFGVAATLISSTNTRTNVVYEVVKSVFENFNDFKTLHPAFAHLEKEHMVSDSLSAPLHDGSINYFKEVGLL